MSALPSLAGTPLGDVVSAIAPTLCDSCLGRLFARTEPGLGNPARGRALRKGPPPSSEVCDLCEGLTQRYEAWTRLCEDASSSFEFESFLVGCVSFDEIRDREVGLFARLLAADGTGWASQFPTKPTSPPWPAGEWLKNEINREVGRLLEARMGKRVDFLRPDVTFRLDTRFDHVELQVTSLFVRGRYLKFVRDLPQTRWPCRACGGIGCRQCHGTGKTYASSVEELIAAPFLAASQASDEAFHGMGREDIDARTLGTGRPFVLELKRPRRRRLEWARLEAETNEASAGRVQVNGIAPAAPGDAARYKEADPPKTYRARCRSETPLMPGKLLNAVRSLAAATLQQRTPERVAHRRADRIRPRRILGLRLLEESGDRFELEVRAESGTYIKEFVSGDDGRTTPSLAEAVGSPLRVEELDVVDVEWKE